ncbi:hypothetical protein KIN20_034720 [Parelaphostrongylus tenuis]|uniref:Uncharacterized protein n=1 Tax=Parelaphostrongylus tenuis TaxID=148309 RepID=A0AAD5RA39_PARTN|nr:hypothetical protein KIN20_034720 [Parelaphostrongylus tenuis]
MNLIHALGRTSVHKNTRIPTAMFRLNLGCGSEEGEVTETVAAHIALYRIDCVINNFSMSRLIDTRFRKSFLNHR